MAHAEQLLAFVDAVVTGTEEELAGARQTLLRSVGAAAFVDAAAVVGNFERMVRIADSTGISLDTPVKLLSEDLREDLGVERFDSSQNTRPSGPLDRTLGRVLRPLMSWALRFLGPRLMKE